MGAITQRDLPIKLVRDGKRVIDFLCLFLADYFVLSLALWLSIKLRIFWGTSWPFYANFHLPFKGWMVAIPLLMMAFIAYEGLYTKRRPFAQGAQRLFKATFFAMILTIVLLFLTHTYDVSRLVIFLYWALGFLFLLAERYFLKILLVKAGLWRQSVLIIGAGKTASLLADAFENDKGLGYHIVGLIEDRVEERPLTTQYPCFGGFEQIQQAIALTKPDEVIIAAPGIGRERLLDVLYAVQPLAKRVSLAPDLYGMPLSNLEADTFFNQKVVLLKITNNLAKPWNQLLKRMFDLIVGAVALMFFLIPMMIIAFLIKCNSPGAVFFNAKRIGKRNCEFLCYKFRTMYENNDDIFKRYLENNPDARDEWGKYAKLRGEDPRITPIGKVLRRLSLDELPQLFNVLKGDMSLVGPRPYLPREKKDIGKGLSDVAMVLPGITGLWQVSGRNNVPFEERVQMDIWYVRNWSVWIDIVVLFRTVGVVIGKNGAY